MADHGPSEAQARVEQALAFVMGELGRMLAL
jgi:hypothetical protein